MQVCNFGNIFLSDREEGKVEKKIFVKYIFLSKSNSSCCFLVLVLGERLEGIGQDPISMYSCAPGYTYRVLQISSRYEQSLEEVRNFFGVHHVVVVEEREK